MQQVLFIHGGNTLESYGEFINHLKTGEINLDYFRSRKAWKDGLAGALGPEFNVFVPLMIGHSLGGVFLAKYLSENESPKKIKTATVVAAPFDDEGGAEKLASFSLKAPLDNFARQAGEIHLFHSKDDPYVPIAQLEKYQKALPAAQTHVFEDRGHFRQESFPEMVDLTRRIASK